MMCILYSGWYEKTEFNTKANHLPSNYEEDRCLKGWIHIVTDITFSSLVKIIS